MRFTEAQKVSAQTPVLSQYDWCFLFDFTISPYDNFWASEENNNGDPKATWEQGTGWVGDDTYLLNNGFQYQNQITIRGVLQSWAVDPATVSFVYADLVFSYRQVQGNILSDNNPYARVTIGTIFEERTGFPEQQFDYESMSRYSSQVFTDVFDEDQVSILVWAGRLNNTAPVGGKTEIHSLEFRGLGTNPFGQDNCGQNLPPTPTPIIATSTPQTYPAYVCPPDPVDSDTVDARYQGTCQHCLWQEVTPTLEATATGSGTTTPAVTAQPTSSIPTATPIRRTNNSPTATPVIEQEEVSKQGLFTGNGSWWELVDGIYGNGAVYVDVEGTSSWSRVVSMRFYLSRLSTSEIDLQSFIIAYDLDSPNVPSWNLLVTSFQANGSQLDEQAVLIATGSDLTINIISLIASDAHYLEVVFRSAESPDQLNLAPSSVRLASARATYDEIGASSVWDNFGVQCYSPEDYPQQEYNPEDIFSASGFQETNEVCYVLFPYIENSRIIENVASVFVNDDVQVELAQVELCISFWQFPSLVLLGWRFPVELFVNGSMAIVIIRLLRGW
ncbi:MAG: hypothetical protein AAF846_11155 [Chloroflexota bacterium]